MPMFTFHTNVAGSKVTPDLLKKLSSTVASALGKPEGYVAINVIPDQHMIFGGTSEPCGLGDLGSLGAIGGAKNAKISGAIMAVITASLGVPGDRMYISFHNMAGSDIGYNNGTF